VDVDNVQAAVKAVDHLLALGHRCVGMITNAPLVYAASQQRLEGYRRGLRKAGIAYREELVREGNFDEESGYGAIRDLLAMNDPPTAAFVASDMVAMGALRALHDCGVRVPEDMAIVGFDDITAARFITPGLTTFHVPTFGLGWSAAELLIRIIQGDRPHRTDVRLGTELMVRESCGALCAN
jgi:LacI family transcriptional regulator